VLRLQPLGHLSRGDMFCPTSLLSYQKSVVRETKIFWKRFFRETIENA
jgi:hypothetical protein